MNAVSNPFAILRGRICSATHSVKKAREEPSIRRNIIPGRNVRVIRKT